MARKGTWPRLPSRVVAPDGTALPVHVAAPPEARAVLVLANGAGTSMRHPSLVGLAAALVERGIATVTFDFPYRARGGGAPDRLPLLVGAYEAVLAEVRKSGPPPVFIGGRSLGGRVASHVAAAGAAVDGLVFLAFPLHRPGEPGTGRAAHLAAIRRPMLFVQGTRDTFARWDLLAGVVGELPTATLHAIADGDHGFHVPKRTGRTDDQVLEEAADVVARWISATVDSHS
jgi:predicted alpha/beta-hydrolase family hydrolase